MGAFPGNGSGHAASQLLPSLVVLAALPALAMLVLWKGEGLAAPANAKKCAGDKARQEAEEDEGRAEAETAATKAAVVVVDPYSSGGVLARLAHDEGYQARASMLARHSYDRPTIH